MKKILFVIISFLIVFSSCSNSNEAPTNNKKKSSVGYFTNNPKAKNHIVTCENNKVPLYMQYYNSIKPNVKDIKVISLTITMGTDYACKGYLTTEWVISGDYSFEEEKYTYLVECDEIRVMKDYICWNSHWPEKHPFIDK